jgi:hypothetical protein
VDTREEKLVEVRTAESGGLLGILDIRYPHVFQIHEVPLDAEAAGMAGEEGIVLTMTRGKEPLYIFGESGPGEVHRPHLLFDNGTSYPLEEFYARLFSRDSIQQFGWMEGCVLEGLLDLAESGNPAIPEERKSLAAETARAHLSLFIDAGGNLRYESPRSLSLCNAVYGIEGGLPFASLTRVDPGHPLLGMALSFWRSRRERDPAIRDDEFLSAEGAYTAAYPLALAGRAAGLPEASAWAAEALLDRRDLLVRNGVLNLRYNDIPVEGYPNWARAHAWYLLGLVRTLELIREDPRFPELRAELVRAAARAAAFQGADGLWTCFLGRPETGAETSGTAGIAAAFARGCRSGLLPVEYRAAAEKALRGLLPRLSPDGLLLGAAPSNKGGIALQESGFRVPSQVGMGLLAQLIANL